MKRRNVRNDALFTDVSLTDVSLTDELRDYYLDAMGIQRWVLQQVEKTGTTEEDYNDEKILSSLREDGAQLETDAVSRLEQEITTCHACALAKDQCGRVFGMGNPAAKLMLIIIAPEQLDLDQSDMGQSGQDQSGHQDQGITKNLLLSAQSVQLLTKMLQAIRVNINDVFITSLLKCVIPARQTIMPAEITACRHHLDQQIDIMQPDRLFVMGELAAQCLLGNNEKIDSLREQRYEYAGRSVCISYSTDELRLQPENKRKAWLDLQRLQQQLLKQKQQ